MSATSDLNKANTIRFFNEVFNDGKMGVIDILISPEYKFNGIQTSPDGTRQWAEGLRAALPDLHFSIECILAEDAHVALRWRMTATKAGKAGYITGTNILVFSNGQAIANDQAGGSDFIEATKPMQ